MPTWLWILTILITGVCTFLAMRECDGDDLLDMLMMGTLGASLGACVAILVAIIPYGIWLDTHQPQGWVGRTRAEIIQAYGIPSEETTSPNGESVLIWRTYHPEVNSKVTVGDTTHIQISPAHTSQMRVVVQGDKIISKED